MTSGRRLLWVIVVAATVTCAAVLALQRQEQTVLRSEKELLRDQARELAQVRAENERLKAQQIPASELARLRADHTELVRLRAEIDALKQRTSR
jgi:hypothetical protein